MPFIRILLTLQLVITTINLSSAATINSSSIKTSFGLIRVGQDRQSLKVRNHTVFTGNNDALFLLFHFKLKQEEAILFVDACGGNDCANPDDLYFLILKAGADPAIVTADGFDIRGDVKKAWKESDTIIVDLGYAKRAKLVSNEVTIIPKEIYPIEKKDCRAIYNLSKSYCYTKQSTHSNPASKCEIYTTDPLIISGGLSLAEMGDINSIIREHPGFKSNEWQEICITWCHGNIVTPSDFARNVCSISRP